MNLRTSKVKILLGILGIFIFASAVFGAYKLGQKQIQPGPQPTPTPVAVATPTSLPSEAPAKKGDPTANWKTYTNNVYSYTIKYPPNFKIGLCKNCNPPEIRVSLENMDKTISIGIEYAHQFTLCGNSPSPCIPTNNLRINVMGKEYTHEEYYIDYYKRYIFKIEDIERNGQASQISISGAYDNVSDAKLIDQILSTFRFLE